MSKTTATREDWMGSHYFSRSMVAGLKYAEGFPDLKNNPHNLCPGTGTMRALQRRGLVRYDTRPPLTRHWMTTNLGRRKLNDILKVQHEKTTENQRGTVGSASPH